MLSNGVSSVRSRVDNLSRYLPSITNEIVYQSIMRQFMKTYYPNIKYKNVDSVITRLKNEKNQTNKDIMNKYNYIDIISMDIWLYAFIHKFFDT